MSAIRRPEGNAATVKGLVLGALCLFVALAVPGIARADEITRRLQEELRKRSLYFGDIDGQLSAQVAEALRRYQERKGFPPTGTPDEDTLRSLAIGPVPTRGVEDRSSSRHWPDVAVLKSDMAERELESDTGTAEAAGDAPQARVLASPAPPPMAKTAQQPTVDQVRNFLESYLRAGEANDVKAELAFYGDRVDYFDDGPVDLNFIRRDASRYDARWPERQFTLLEPITLTPGKAPDAFIVRFRYRFNVKGHSYTVQGKVDTTYTLEVRKPDDIRITSMKEQGVRE